MFCGVLQTAILINGSAIPLPATFVCRQLPAITVIIASPTFKSIETYEWGWMTDRRLQPHLEHFTKSAYAVRQLVTPAPQVKVVAGKKRDAGISPPEPESRFLRNLGRLAWQVSWGWCHHLLAICNRITQPGSPAEGPGARPAERVRYCGLLPAAHVQPGIHQGLVQRTARKLGTAGVWRSLSLRWQLHVRAHGTWLSAHSLSERANYGPAEGVLHTAHVVG